MTAISRIGRAIAVLVVVLAAPVASFAQQALLNSERIEQTFGSYGVSILSQDDSLRRTNLYSQENGWQVCRTYAIVRFSHDPDDDIAAIHDAILEGASIGASFVDAGWSVHKTTTNVLSLELSDPTHPLGRLMRLEDPAELAVHVYELTVTRDTESFHYATIIETHHPAYLRLDQLAKLFAAPQTATPQDTEALSELVLVDHWD